MKKSVCTLAVVLFCFCSYQNLFAQQNTLAKANVNQDEEITGSMKTYVIEREIPNAGQLTQEQLKGISQKSCTVLNQMGAEIEWLHSYVADDKVYCLYKASNLELIKEHATKGGFPVNSVQELSTIIGPETAKE